jgi:predicted negative regulator of RcsB-dependent stress response
MYSLPDGRDDVYGRGMNKDTNSCSVCGQPLGENGRCRRCEEATRVWTVRDWRPMLTLGLVIVLGFSFTRLVVGGYDERRNALAEEYYAAGVKALDAQHSAEAVDALENALVYSHGNFQYELKLTDALLASGASTEAMAQLHAFLEQRPGDAQVNLKLARLEARRNHVEDAWRYYQAAIGGAWPELNDPFEQRIDVRFEEAEYLVRQSRTEMAEAALVALAEVLPESSAEQQRLGELFLSNGDAGRALKAYEAALDSCGVAKGGFADGPVGGRSPKPIFSEGEIRNARCQAAVLGTARAELASANYGGARRYLLEIKGVNAEARTLLAQLERMDVLDPFAEESSAQVRARRTVAVFQIAIGRLARCGVPFAQALKGTGRGEDGREAARWSGLARWAEQLTPLMDERKLRGHDDVIESTMRFAFQAEMTAQKDCGNAALDDEALLLLARKRLGVDQ